MSERDQRSILADVKRLAVEYYQVTGKPLGVTGEIAEYEAAEKLGLKLADARTAGYDAIRVPTINLKKPFDTMMLVLIDENYETVEIWEAPRNRVEERLTAPGSKARNERGSMGISQFRSIAEKVWPT